MTTYTSGYRATHGLPPANHDPEPWVWPDGLLRAPIPGKGYLRDIYRFQPRSEFDVPDNPTLVAFRDELPHWAHDNGDGEQYTAADLAKEWLHIDEVSKWVADGRCTIGHGLDARRVLSKLVAVYA